MNVEYHNSEDELSLSIIIQLAWARRWIIALCAIITTSFGAIYLQDAPRIFSVQYIISEVEENKSGSAGLDSGLGLIGQFSGIDVSGAGSGSKLNEFKTLLKSEEVAAVLIQNINLTSRIFKSEWDANSEKFVAPAVTKKSNMIKQIKKYLLGEKVQKYTPPNTQKLLDLIKRKISVKTKRDSGFLTLTARSSNPNLMSDLILEIVNTADFIVRERYKDKAHRELDFYNKRFLKARSQGQKAILSQLILDQNKDLFLVSDEANFVVNKVSGPTISYYPITPKPKIIISLSFALGIFLGIFFAVVLGRRVKAK